MLMTLIPKLGRLGASFMLLFMISACQPKEPPPDLLKTQREAMEKARRVEQVLQKSVDDANRKIDQDSK